MVSHDPFPSRYVKPRRVDVWLPPGYQAKGEHHYPVLYMHDGKNLFDPTTSTFGVTWGVAETLTRLIEAGEIPPVIVVGIWNTEYRTIEYLPAKPFNGLPTAARQKFAMLNPPPQSDSYLAFMVEELKPFIDTTYQTRPERAQTFIMGSSMGGLISLYALCEYPQVFGGAGCLSTHWPAVEGFIVSYLEASLPDPTGHRIYFDYGTTTLDVLYEPGQRVVDQLMAAAGYEHGRNWETHKFPGHPHNELAWRERFEVPVRFLLREIGD